MKKIVVKIVEWLLYFGSPLLATILLEWCIYRDFNFVLDMLINKQAYFMLTYLIALLAQTLLVSIVNNVYVTVLLAQAMGVLIGTATFYKIEFLNEPLLPWDVYLVNQVFDLLPTLSNAVNLKHVIIGIIIIRYSERPSCF